MIQLSQKQKEQLGGKTGSFGGRRVTDKKDQLTCAFHNDMEQTHFDRMGKIEKRLNYVFILVAYQILSHSTNTDFVGVVFQTLGKMVGGN